MFEKEAEEYRKENLCKKCNNHCKAGMCTCSECKIKTFINGAEYGYDKAKEELQGLKNLVEKYRQAVDKCLHITFMGGGCEVHTVGQYATLVDGYLTDVEGLAKWKD